MNKKVQYVIPILLVIWLAWIMIWHHNPVGSDTDSNLVVLLITALIYSLQWIAMNHQKDISKESFKNQEKILSEQKDIADKQYKFNLFCLRMNLRNELEKAFVCSLTPTGHEISDDVNMKLVEMGKILNDIQQSFTKNSKLNELIKKFKKVCENITIYAQDKQLLIECSEKKKCGDGYVLEYKDCLRVYSNLNGQIGDMMINKELFDKYRISNKQRVIICGIMMKYINTGNNKFEIENYVVDKFNKYKNEGNRLLNEITRILDKEIYWE